MCERTLIRYFKGRILRCVDKISIVSILELNPTSLLDAPEVSAGSSHLRESPSLDFIIDLKRQGSLIVVPLVDHPSSSAPPFVLILIEI